MVFGIFLGQAPIILHGSCKSKICMITACLLSSTHRLCDGWPPRRWKTSGATSSLPSSTPQALEVGTSGLSKGNHGHEMPCDMSISIFLPYTSRHEEKIGLSDSSTPAPSSSISPGQLPLVWRFHITNRFGMIQSTPSIWSLHPPLEDWPRHSWWHPNLYLQCVNLKILPNQPICTSITGLQTLNFPSPPTFEDHIISRIKRPT